MRRRRKRKEVGERPVYIRTFALPLHEAVPCDRLTARAAGIMQTHQRSKSGGVPLGDSYPKYGRVKIGILDAIKPPSFCSANGALFNSKSFEYIWDVAAAKHWWQA